MKYQIRVVMQPVLAGWSNPRQWVVGYRMVEANNFSDALKIAYDLAPELIRSCRAEDAIRS